jgi:2-oxoglutarate ferredoxin oxidoreductase subunit gamma
MGTQKLFIAGSGGQGILLMGQMVTYAAMLEDRNATFFPSYGPEMRGGTANCTVVVSDRPISCPLIYEADVLVAMNAPSLVKFAPMVKPSGKIILNKSLIDHPVQREDVDVLEIPANDMALELGSAKAANMVMLSALLRATNIVSTEAVEKVLEKTFTGTKSALIDLNRKALHFYQ